MSEYCVFVQSRRSNICDSITWNKIFLVYEFEVLIDV
jgi:hypothetical protein